MTLARVILIISIFISEITVASPQCSQIFSSHDSIRALAQFRLDLDLIQAKGANLNLHQTALRADYAKKEKQLIDHLESQGLMTRAEFFEKIKAEIFALQNLNKSGNDRQDQEKQERKALTQEHSRKIHRAFFINKAHLQFHEIEPGSFKMGHAEGSPVDVTLTKPFAMASTPTTQMQWKIILNLYIKNFRGENNNLYLYPSHHNGETHPVENVARIEVKIWISKLNKLSQLGVPVLVDLFPGHKKGDVYRLPTEAEWEYVVRGRAQLNDLYHFGNDVKELDKYAWHSGNSGNMTHPVAEKLPLVFEGKEFFDMYGNVNEWLADNFEKSPPGGVDPLVNLESRIWMVRGNSYRDVNTSFSSFARAGHESRPMVDTGFRLVREVRP